MNKPTLIWIFWGLTALMSGSCYFVPLHEPFPYFRLFVAASGLIPAIALHHLIRKRSLHTTIYISVFFSASVAGQALGCLSRGLVTNNPAAFNAASGWGICAVVAFAIFFGDLKREEQSDALERKWDRQLDDYNARNPKASSSERMQFIDQMLEESKDEGLSVWTRFIRNPKVLYSFAGVMLASTIAALAFAPTNEKWQITLSFALCTLVAGLAGFTMKATQKNSNPD